MPSNHYSFGELCAETAVATINLTLLIFTFATVLACLLLAAFGQTTITIGQVFLLLGLAFGSAVIMSSVGLTLVWLRRPRDSLRVPVYIAEDVGEDWQPFPGQINGHD